MNNDDIDRELRSHLENEAEDQRENGLSAIDAEFAARRALGNVARIKEEVRAVSPWSTVDDFAQDLRYGLRMLRKHPCGPQILHPGHCPVPARIPSVEGAIVTAVRRQCWTYAATSFFNVLHDPPLTA